MTEDSGKRGFDREGLRRGLKYDGGAGAETGRSAGEARTAGGFVRSSGERYADRTYVRTNGRSGGRGAAQGGNRHSGDPGRRDTGARASRRDGTPARSFERGDASRRAHAAQPTNVPRLRAGEVVSLDVAREVSPNGYFLTDGHQDVLMHYSEAVGPIQIGEPIDVFLYHDTEDRLTATMRRPKLLLGQVGLLEVTDIHPRYGLFLEMGLGRNLLLPYSELPEMEELRPQIGDSVYVTLANDRQGRLVAKLAGEEELAPKCFHAPAAWRSSWVEARVYKPLQMGTFVVCDGGVVGFGVIGFIPGAERTRLLRLGETLKVRVTFVREDGRVNLSMRQQKELGLSEDAERVLTFLKERPNGAMPYSDETPADVIAKKFGISKAAFKRALGKLMREQAVYQEGNWTYLRQSGEGSQEHPPQP